MTILGLIGAATVVLLAGLALLLLHLAHTSQRVPPARPRATLREALDETGEQVDRTVFPPRTGGWRT
jgi:hypothetical protein